MLFHWGCSSGKQNNFPRLLVTKKQLFRQCQFLELFVKTSRGFHPRCWTSISEITAGLRRREWGEAATSSQNSRTEFRKWWQNTVPCDERHMLQFLPPHWCEKLSTPTELLCISTCSEQLPLSEAKTPRVASMAALGQAGPAEVQERMENNCQAHGIRGMLCYLKFLQRKRKLRQTLTITIFLLHYNK